VDRSMHTPNMTVIKVTSFDSLSCIINGLCAYCSRIQAQIVLLFGCSKLCRGFRSGQAFESVHVTWESC